MNLIRTSAGRRRESPPETDASVDGGEQTGFMTYSRLPFPLRVALASAMGAVAVASLAGCVRFGSDDGAVTYEITTDATSPHDLTAVAYRLEPDRGQPSELVDEGTMTTESDPAGGTVLKIESVIAAEERASVTARPPEGVTATCRILLDDVREIATTTGEPGEPVSCDVKTPAFQR